MNTWMQSLFQSGVQFLGFIILFIIAIVLLSNWHFDPCRYLLKLKEAPTQKPYAQYNQSSNILSSNKQWSSKENKLSENTKHCPQPRLDFRTDYTRTCPNDWSCNEAPAKRKINMKESDLEHSSSNDQSRSKQNTLNENISREVGARLFDISGVKSYGYSNTVLNIFIEADAKKQTETCNLIENTLVDCNITSFEIIPIKEKLLFLSGSKVHVPLAKEQHAATIGTIGGFLRRTVRQSRTLCAITARHVTHANQSNRALYLDDERAIGNVLPDGTSNNGQYIVDISAVEIFAELQPRCDTKFFDAHGSPFYGQLYTLSEISVGDLVHIWGAISKPGLGKIKMTSLITRDQSKGMMLIEDRDEDIFCHEGDSGAFVCVAPHDQYIPVIAMLIKEYDECNLGESKCAKRYYVAINLFEALCYLSAQYGGCFSIIGNDNKI